MQARSFTTRRIVGMSAAFIGGSVGAGSGAWAQCTAPSINSQPAGGNVHEGAVATLGVGALGTDPLSYQWSRDGVALTDDARFAGTTTSVLQIRRSARADSGVYTVRVSNTCGSAESDGAQLHVACIADWNFSGAVNSQDFFDLLHDFFNHSQDFPTYWDCPLACTSQVFFDFLSAFFGGC